MATDLKTNDYNSGMMMLTFTRNKMRVDDGAGLDGGGGEQASTKVPSENAVGIVLILPLTIFCTQ
jgi:hypothetical protein